jgi:dihydroorotate dehydrogenase (fumarate)
MADLNTSYMGLQLKNPFIAASSGLTDSKEKIKHLEEEGIAAVVLKSLFEEQILMDIDAQGVNNMFNTFTDAENYVSYYTKQHSIKEYLKLIEDSKKAVDIPVIASINCLSAGEWVNFAKQIEHSGADALELNMFILPSDPEYTSEQIEHIYFEVVSKIKEITSLPVALKISSYFSAMANTLIKLSDSGISALVMFNRFYNPDIDLEKELITSSRLFSVPEENDNNLRWIGLLSGKLNCDISSTTGIISGSSALKNILVGAQTVQIASALYQNKSGFIQKMLNEFETWMQDKNYGYIDEFRGKLNASNVKHSVMYERAQFMKYYSDYH